MKNLEKIEIRMYGLGTGDCFVLKFISKTGESFSMMVDGGAWSYDKDFMREAVKDLKSYVDKKLDVLVVTHEHLDHVNLFEGAEDLFRDKEFKLGEIWMAWTENENDELARSLKDKFGQKKKALAIASQRLRDILEDQAFKRGLSNSFNNLLLDMLQ